MIERIVSGGQTGVDRAALDVAIVRGIPHGGWCPAGRLAEDGAIPVHYQLAETPRPNHAERTEWNVRDSDGTVVVTPGIPEGGTALTVSLADVRRRPCLVLDADTPIPVGEFANWIDENRIRVLNVAGPRVSNWSDGYRRTLGLLNELLDGVPSCPLRGLS